MARIRTVKPEFWSTPGIETLDPMWRLLYIGMWNWADDYGRGSAEARALMGFVFPRDEEMTLGEFRRGLGEVRRVFGVKFYKVEGRSYYFIPSWEKHQKIDKRSKSRYPAVEQGTLYDPTEKPQVRACETTLSTEPAETPPSIRRDSGAGTEETGTGEVGKGNLLTSHVASDDDDDVAPVEAEIIERPEIEDLLDQLEHRIRANGNRPGNRTKTAHDAIRRMIDIDGYTVEQISFIIDWSQASEFWQANILSAKKLRDKMPTLVAQARRDHQNPTREQQAQRDLADDNDYMPEWAKTRTS